MTQNQPKGNFIINAQYIKDLSFEVPSGAGAFFFNGTIEPLVSFDVNALGVDKDVYEVALKFKIEFKVDSKIVYICDIDYRGVFTISGTEEPAELNQILMSQCPQFLYPYVRAAITQVTAASSFPAPNLNPIDFFGLYLAKLQENQDGQPASEEIVKN